MKSRKIIITAIAFGIALIAIFFYVEKIKENNLFLDEHLLENGDRAEKINNKAGDNKNIEKETFILDGEESSIVQNNFEKQETEIQGEKKEIIKEEVEQDEFNQLINIINSFIGRPYLLGPLGEKDEEKLYRTDLFDCTTLILVTASIKNNPDDPEEMIKKINYYPENQVSYENRLHFSSYRNNVSNYFIDITKEVAGEYLKTKKVLLNKKNENGRLLDIDWEKEIILNYVDKGDVLEVIDNLPKVVGVMFIRDGDEKIGLDIRHEGFIISQEKLIHASSLYQKVYEENFLEYLDKQNYDAVSFYKLN